MLHPKIPLHICLSELTSTDRKQLFKNATLSLYHKDQVMVNTRDGQILVVNLHNRVNKKKATAGDH